jgi:hypothetical protein
MSTRLVVRANGMLAAVPKPAVEDVSWWPVKGDRMARFVERDGRTPVLVVSGTQVLLSSLTLLSVGSVIWVLFQQLLFNR